MKIRSLQVANNILKVSNLASAPLFNDIFPFSAPPITKHA